MTATTAAQHTGHIIAEAPIPWGAHPHRGVGQAFVVLLPARGGAGALARGPAATHRH
jgi:hypothetical protein